MTPFRLANYIAYPVLLVAALLGFYWVWGLLFLWWLVPTIRSGQAFLMFDITRAQDPLLFWAVVVLWAVFGLMMIAASLFPQYSTWLI